MSYPAISDREIEEQILSYMAQLGISPAPYERLILDGNLHRYDIDGERRNSQHGAYIIHADGLPAGYVQDWKKGISSNWKFDQSGLTQEHRKYFKSEEYLAHELEIRQKREQALKEKQAEAAEYSRILWEALSEAPEDHPYLQAKQIPPYGVRVNDEGNLAIPLRDINGKVNSLQWIDTEGNKRFQVNTAIHGLFWSVGLDTLGQDADRIILLGEGFATMAKVYELTGYPSVAGIACGFLRPVAQALREKYPAAQIYVMADNDKATEKKRGVNPGLKAANELVKSGLADYVIAPEFPEPEDGTDWDDYALLYGDEECARVITAKLKEAPLKAKQERYRQQAEQLGLVSYEMFETFCQPVKSPSWLIEDWMPAESLMMLFAPSGSRKGFLMCDLAYAVSNPNITHWHGKKILTHGPVVYIAGEGQRGMRKRFAGIVYHTGVSVNGLKMAIIKEPIMIDEKDAKAGILRAITNIGSIYPCPVLVIFDTLNANMSGDENKTADATTFIHSCNRIMQELQSTVILVHHTGLNPETQGRARGSSVLKAAMDVEMKLTRNGHILTLEMTKSKDTELQPPLVFNMTSVEVPGFYKATGEADMTCVLELNESVTEILSDTANRENTEAKPTKAEQFAKDTYQEAVRKHGVLVPDEERGREVVALGLEYWRDVFYEMSSADKIGTKRQQFSRTRSLLLEEKHILFKKEMDGEEYYCLEPSGDAYESAMLLYLRRKRDETSCQD